MKKSTINKKISIKEISQWFQKYPNTWIRKWRDMPVAFIWGPNEHTDKYYWHLISFGEPEKCISGNSKTIVGATVMVNNLIKECGVGELK